MQKIELEPLTQADVEAIRNWPPYPAAVQELDYALRAGGWLDQFPESETTHRYAARENDELIGFTLLTHIANGACEFYIALHPQHIGQGLGRPLTERTLQLGFDELGLTMIYLKVREWHQRAIALYTNIGFKIVGRFTETIREQSVRFIRMEFLNQDLVR